MLIFPILEKPGGTNIQKQLLISVLGFSQINLFPDLTFDLINLKIFNFKIFRKKKARKKTKLKILRTIKKKNDQSYLFIKLENSETLTY